MNRIFLVGRLVRNPELRNISEGSSVCTFTLAVDRRKKDAGADFIQISAWNKLSDLCYKYLAKGSMAAVIGALQTRNYEDKNGNKRTAYEVQADEVQFVGAKQQQETEEPIPEKNTVTMEETEEELPF